MITNMTGSVNINGVHYSYTTLDGGNYQMQIGVSHGDGQRLIVRCKYNNFSWDGIQWHDINNDLAVVHARIDNLIGISLSDKPDRDINNIKTSGLFNIDPTFTNRPPQSESWMFLINTVHGGGDSNYITQFAWNMNGPKDFFCFRKKVGTWQGWQTIWEAK